MRCGRSNGGAFVREPSSGGPFRRTYTTATLLCAACRGTGLGESRPSRQETVQPSRNCHARPSYAAATYADDLIPVRRPPRLFVLTPQLPPLALPVLATFPASPLGVCPNHGRSR